MYDENERTKQQVQVKHPYANSGTSSRVEQGHKPCCIRLSHTVCDERNKSRHARAFSKGCSYPSPNRLPISLVTKMDNGMIEFRFKLRLLRKGMKEATSRVSIAGWTSWSS